jgi:hypothetical protein
MIRHDEAGGRVMPPSKPAWKVMAAANRLDPHHETLNPADCAPSAVSNDRSK